MVIVNEVRKGFYLDSVALMRIARALRDLDGIEEAGLMIGTPANMEIMREANVLAAEGEAAGAGDLVVAIRAKSGPLAEAAIKEARSLLDQPRRSSGAAAAWQPRSIRAAIEQTPGANLALISVPGDFAVAEARKALRRGLNVMIFSDNVPVADEVALKQEARALGLLVMGPDCGTAIIGGVPLAFANVVPRGDIGIIGASGTGIQEVSCLLARAGRGVSHAIGTGGRDLKAEVGAITTLMAIDAFDADPATRHVVLISKPPAANVAKAVLARIAMSAKPFTICFLGANLTETPRNATSVSTLEAAAEHACGQVVAPLRMTPPRPRAGARNIRGLFTGGTLCAEAQVIALAAGVAVASNVPIPGATQLDAGRAGLTGHSMIDLGDDDYTRGRPHPMIEPAIRDQAVLDALNDPATAVVLLDCVLGFGGHADPAGHLARLLRGRPEGGPVIIASVTGTDNDPQRYGAQADRLIEAGVVVEPSNAAAVRLALRCLGL